MRFREIVARRFKPNVLLFSISFTYYNIGVIYNKISEIQLF